MRITGGNLRNRIVKAPPANLTRPMQDRVRAALFSAIGAVEGKTVLDAYAGSGIVGFEALSRKAHLVEAVESSNKVVSYIQNNQKILGLEKNYILHKNHLETWLDRLNNQEKLKYDLIIADPPYERLDHEVLNRLGNLLRDKGLMVVSHSSKIKISDLKNLILIRTSQYGDTALSYYTKG